MDDEYSEFSSIDDRIIDDMPEEQNPNDIQDFSSFPRDSFVDHTPNKYLNNKNTSSPFNQNMNMNFNNINDDDSSEDNETGYSNVFNKNMPLYQQVPQFQNYKKNSKDVSYSSQRISQMNNNNNMNAINNINNMNNMNYYQQQQPNYNYYNKSHISNQKKYMNKESPPANLPIPQDTLIEDEEEEQEQEQEQEQEEEEDNNNNIIYVNNNDNDSNDIDDNNIQKQIPKPEFTDQKKLEELLSICKKRGNYPSIDDFSLESWKVFYPKTDKFFLWNKGNVFPNQVLIKNENDKDNLEIYQGEINSKNEKHGIGKLTTPKYIRVGTWREDEFTGWGREARINGDVFEGRFVDGAIYGKGINQNYKGNIYVGEFIDSKREGKGELKTKKIHYVGDFKYDRFNGKGKLVFLTQGHEYEGEFKNNEINGIGTFKWNNGDIYEGEMKNGKLNGYGKYTYSNGQIYEGIYVNGIKEGLGKLIAGNRVYEGEFKNGKPDGEGVLTLNGKRYNIIYKDGKFRKK